MRVMLFLWPSLLILLSVNSVVALSFEMQESYQPYETMIIKILGPVLEPLYPSNVKLQRQHVQVAFEYDIKRIGDDYFVYGIAPLSSQNYTLILEDAATLVNGQRQLLALEQVFSVSEETVSYTLRPGFIIATADFEISLTSHQDQPEAIFVGAQNSSVILAPGENKIRFSIQELNSGFNFLTVGRYKMPVFVIKPLPVETQVQNITGRVIQLAPGYIVTTLIRGEEHLVTFRIINVGAKEIKKFIFDYDDERYQLAPKTFSRLNTNGSAEFNLTLKAMNESFEDTIKITADNETLDLYLNITYTLKDITSVNISSFQNGSRPAQGYYCEELNGKICSSGEQCSGEIIQSLNGPCCKAPCTVKEKNSYAWVGYLIGLLVFVVLFIVGARYLKSKKGKMPSLTTGK